MKLKKNIKLGLVPWVGKKYWQILRVLDFLGMKLHDWVGYIILALDQLKLQISWSGFDTLGYSFKRTFQGPLQNGVHGRDDLLERDFQVATRLVKPGDGKGGKEIAGAHKVGLQMRELNMKTGRSRIFQNAAGKADKTSCK